MPTIFGNLSQSIDLSKADNADANFYSTIRQTIQGLDRLIHDVIFTGSGFHDAFLVNSFDRAL